MTSLEKTLTRIAGFLNRRKIPYMVIGGVANLFWGVPRTTLDVDVTVQLQEVHYGRLLEAVGKKFSIRVKDPILFIKKTNVLPLEDKRGVRIDLIFAKLPYEAAAIRRAKVKRLRGVAIRICGPEDLIVHKIISDRVRDQEDVRGIIGRMGRRLNRRYLDPLIQELSEALGKPAILGFYKRCFKKG